MNLPTSEIRYFFFSQHFSDGLRITLGLLLPSLLFSYLGHLQTGFAISLGALLVSISDFPGPVVHKRNGMLLANLFIFLMALLTGFVRLNDYLLGLEIVLASFFFSMFLVYGNRAAALGTAAIVVMIMTMDNNLKPEEVLPYSGRILAGGVWYMLLSLAFFRIRPYLQVQQALGECIHETAKFLRIKAGFYRTRTNLEEDFRKVVSQQVVVNEKQDAVREVLLKSRQLVKESTPTSRILVLAFVDVVDLFEQIMAIHYDYATLRKKYAQTGIMDEIATIISRLADQLDQIGFAIQSNLSLPRPVNLTTELETLKNHIDALGTETELSTLALKKVLVNLRNLTLRLTDIQQYFLGAAPGKLRTLVSQDFSRFVSHQDFDLRKFKDNLTFRSGIFRHSVRVSLACLAGYAVTSLLPFGLHSYWVLLTIIVILKPAFSLTRQRNYERITGTVAGAGIGMLLLYFIRSHTALLILLVGFMVGTFSFQRRNYIVSVLFMTPFILILFHFLGSGELSIVEERITDTLIGSAIAFAASYLLFPTWEKEQIQEFVVAILKANQQYLQKLADALAGREVKPADYKLARKEVFVRSANLSAAFQRMSSEPKSKQKNSREVHKFVVLNHILSSYIATVASALLAREKVVYPEAYQRPVKSSLAVLQESIRKLEPGSPANLPETTLPATVNTSQKKIEPEDQLLPEQLEFIRKVCHDIGKSAENLLA